MYGKISSVMNSLGAIGIILLLMIGSAQAQETSEEVLKTGMDYEMAGRYTDAAEEFTKAIQLDPRFSKAYLERGIVYAAQGYTDKAISDYSEAIKIASDYAEAYRFRGFSYLDKKEVDLAIADFTDALKINPQDEDAKMGLRIANNAKASTGE